MIRDYHIRAIKSLICKVLPHKWERNTREYQEQDTKDHVKKVWDYCKRCGADTGDKEVYRISEKDMIAQEERELSRYRSMFKESNLSNQRKKYYGI